MRLGFTLIEEMIAVAILGIFSALAWAGFGYQRQAATQVVLRERARQVLNYAAASRLAGHDPNPRTVAALTADLPQGRFEAASDDRLDHYLAHWRGMGGRTQTLQVALLRGPR